ncbi:aminopeptidase [Leptospira idonii]
MPHLQCVPYLFHLGKEQAHILLGREKIEKVLAEKKLEPKFLEKLKLIQEAREYAISKLGLNEKGGFVYYTHLDRDEIGWNVSASQTLAFESYTWWFPIAGTVPYKGYFDKKLAQELETSLKEEGYDTRIRVIGGYSTLGWFSDPVLSPQLSWKEHRLVGLVFHELAHATAYLPGDSDLNESYASFVEEKGMEIYYLEKEGKASKSLEDAKKDKAYRQKTLQLLSRYAKKLESLYASVLGKEEKLNQKRNIISEFKREVIEQNLVPKEKAEEFQKKEWNNEDFLGVLRYHSGENSFEKLFKESGENFPKFHESVRKLFQLSDRERKDFLKN